MFQPISPTDLKPLTEIDILPRLIAALGTELGEYEPELPAAYLVHNPDTDPPKNFRTTGIELLVHVTEPRSPIPLHHNAALPNLWEIRLIQYDRSRSLIQAYQNLLGVFPDAYISSHIKANRDVNEQLNLSISYLEIIR